MDISEIIKHSQVACEALSADDDGLKREVLTHAGNRWSLGIVYALGVAGPLRHAEIGRRMEGVTQRMLTRTLRTLEREVWSCATTTRKCRHEWSINSLSWAPGCWRT